MYFSYYSKIPILQHLPLWTGTVFCLVYVHQIMTMMLSHLTKEDYSPWNRIYIINAFSLVANTLASQTLG